jgi:hypothetical protein
MAMLECGSVACEAAAFWKASLLAGQLLRQSPRGSARVIDVRHRPRASSATPRRQLRGLRCRTLNEATRRKVGSWQARINLAPGPVYG